MVYRLLPLATCGGGSLPPGRGRLCATIQRRQTFCAAIQSPAENSRATSGVRSSSPPRQQTEVSQLLPGTHAQPGPVIAIELRRPLPRPAQGDDGALAAAVHVEVAEVAVGWPAARGGDLLAFVRPEHAFQRLIIGRRIRATLGIVKNELALLGALQACVNRQQIFDDRSRDGAAVPQINRPLDDREIIIADRHRAPFQARVRVRVSRYIFRAVLVYTPRDALRRPGSQQLARSPACIPEREGRIG